MKTQQSSWFTAMRRAVLVHGSFGLVIAALVLVLPMVLPKSFYESQWNEIVFFFEKRAVLFGGILGIAWWPFVSPRMDLKGLVVWPLYGICLWTVGELAAILPLVCSLAVGLLPVALAWDIFKEIDTVKGYAGKVNADMGERLNIIYELQKIIASTDLQLLWHAAVETMKTFRAYPNNPDARKAINAQAKCRKAM